MQIRPGRDDIQGRGPGLSFVSSRFSFGPRQAVADIYVSPRHEMSRFAIGESAKINRLALRDCSGGEPVLLVVFRATFTAQVMCKLARTNCTRKRVQPDYFFAAFFAGLVAAFFFGDGLAAVLAAGFAAAAFFAI